MRISQLLSLPPSLAGLLLDHAIGCQAQSLPWPYNLPPHVKYYPEDETLVKRNMEIEQRLRSQAPVGMRKMSSDPGEKFFPEYWQFTAEDTVSYLNASMPNLEPPLRPHGLTKPRRALSPRAFVANLFDKRDFECPAGSRACTDIDRPDSCCENGSTCQFVPDNGLGDVGCCPSNEVCGGSVSQCPQDYSSCPNEGNGQSNGCCLPGYACFEQGCVATSTIVVVVTPTSTSQSSTSLVSSSPIIPPVIPPSTSGSQSPTRPPPSSSSASISTPPSSPTPTPTPTPSSTSQPSNSLVCSPGFKSCPASVGGGCCPTDRACGRDVCPALSSTASFSAPGRPTSVSATATITSTGNGFSSIPGICPTGFYACSAYYQGGCCQTGRNCDTTSCPETASITVVDGSTLTAIAPTGSGISSAPSILTGACASGWSTCGQSVGGGCCPNGYVCGTSCTASVTGGPGSTVGRIAPNNGAKQGVDLGVRMLMVMVMAMGVAGLI